MIYLLILYVITHVLTLLCRMVQYDTICIESYTILGSLYEQVKRGFTTHRFHPSIAASLFWPEGISLGCTLALLSRIQRMSLRSLWAEAESSIIASASENPLPTLRLSVNLRHH